MKKLTIGILAHVDAGKTTLSEGLLYASGNLSRLGRVDKRDAYLDTHSLERERGITIFSKQAILELGNTQITLDCLSKDFKIDYNKAIDIGVNEFSNDITSMMQKDEFKGECYLKILDNLSNGFDSRFWCFSIVNEEGEHLNCVIDVETGEITAKT